MPETVRDWSLFKAWFHALFVDVPYLIDSAWRRIDFRLNSEYRYAAGSDSPMQARRFWQRVPFWLFLVTVLFVAYGPTLQGICRLAPYPLPNGLLALVGAAGLIALGVLFFRLAPRIRERLDKRFPAAPGADDPARMQVRRSICWAAMWGGAILVLLPAVLVSVTLVDAVLWQGACGRSDFDGKSLAQFALCVLAIGAFAAACSLTTRTGTLLFVQALAIAALAAIQWRWLASAEATEASRLPYRHVFAALAPAVCVALCLAPLIAAWRRRYLPPEAAKHFRQWLPVRELFVPGRGDPKLSATRVFSAIFQGAAYRAPQLALPPALLVLVAPPDWVPSFALGGLVFGLALSTWGNLSSRWRQMIMHVERWFLSGAAFFVSLFVIGIAAARLAGVGYVTTILDSASFGVISCTVAMSYVLSWLVEYWINRVAAIELLRVLGDETGEPKVPYTLQPAHRKKNVAVELDNSFVMCNGIGRFVVVGTVRRDPEQAGPPAPAFHSYDLLELFRVLAGEQPEEQDAARILARHTFLYFFLMNIVLVAAIGGFALYGYRHMTGAVPPQPVVDTRADHGERNLKDLADRLLAAPGDERPALVVAASGGGTRAALYTAHVLEGLHKKGATPDVVLVSGVSGGGVALAYYAANYDKLAADKDPKLPEWARFRQRVARNFIRDVMEGASEWRILGSTPLSVLLAESFERRLLREAPTVGRTLESAASPVLILNTAVAGHPVEDSEVLAKILDDVPASHPDACTERSRVYNLMHGGRLIFTNLKNTSEFPRPGEHWIPDVRLPYHIVQDPAVKLAQAAALNANFPPVFPNAGVLVRNLVADTPCRDRQYFVTDGGAEENLGLVSALFAVRSALEDIRERCGTSRRPGKPDPWCERKLRPIHFVLAEASAAGYDYEQDRGFSAAIGGAKERMTGGLTNQLIEGTNWMVRSLPRASQATEELQFHLLALPLVFRARGGFGTHWMHAERIELSDPRLRTVPGRMHLPWGPGDPTVTVSKDELSRLWTELHDPQDHFCERPAGANPKIDKVREWICGAQKDPRRPRDLHVDAWLELLKKL